MKSKLFTNAYDFVLALLASNRGELRCEVDLEGVNKYTAIEIYTDQIEYFEGPLKLTFGGKNYKINARHETTENDGDGREVRCVVYYEVFDESGELVDQFYVMSVGTYSSWDCNEYYGVRFAYPKIVQQQIWACVE